VKKLNLKQAAASYRAVRRERSGFISGVPDWSLDANERNALFDAYRQHSGATLADIERAKRSPAPLYKHAMINRALKEADKL